MPSFQPPGSFRTLEAFVEYLHRLDPGVHCDMENLGAAGPLGDTAQVCGKRVGNRFAIHPMEGWDGNSDGTPSQHTLRRWSHFGSSGAKLIWGGEAVAVAADGRANTRQLYHNPDADFEQGLRELLRTLNTAHQAWADTPDDLLVGLQLTHSGRFSRPWSSELSPVKVCHRPAVDRRYGINEVNLASDSQLKEIRDRFIGTAQLAQRVGFEFVDVKCCHSYLLHDLLGANSRPGEYGGSFENRTRLLREIIEGIQTACPGLIVAVRLSLFDFAPFLRDEESGEGVLATTDAGDRQNNFAEISPEWSSNGYQALSNSPAWTEARQLLQLLRALGISLINVTLGSPYYCPHMQRPAAYPPSDGYLPPEDPLLGVIRHLRATELLKREFPEFSVVGTGYSYLQQWLPFVAQRQVREGNVDFVGLGRMVLAYPEMPRDILKRKPLERKRICRTFSDCTTGPRNGEISGCYPLDEYYRQMPHAKEIRNLRPSRR